MVVTVIGGSGSGKSAWAEELCLRLPGPLVYVATMRPEGEDAEARILRHRARRGGAGFQTFECFGALEEAAGAARGATVLVDSVGCALANAMFPAGGGTVPPEEAVRSLLEGAASLAGAARNLVAVTDDVSRDGDAYDAGTASYVEALSEANAGLVSTSDSAVEVVCGIPVAFKGEMP